jgi:hypothetical protein
MALERLGQELRMVSVPLPELVSGLVPERQLKQKQLLKLELMLERQLVLELQLA